MSRYSTHGSTFDRKVQRIIRTCEFYYSDQRRSDEFWNAFYPTKITSFDYFKRAYSDD